MPTPTWSGRGKSHRYPATPGTKRTTIGASPRANPPAATARRSGGPGPRSVRRTRLPAPSAPPRTANGSPRPAGGAPAGRTPGGKGAREGDKNGAGEAHVHGVALRRLEPAAVDEPTRARVVHRGGGEQVPRARGHRSPARLLARARGGEERG